MVLAHHLVWVAYGWWLPNDPRGSMSHSIRNDVVADLGALHHGRKRMQPASRDIRGFYEHAERLLQFPLLTFQPSEIEAIAGAFAEVVRAERYTCYACAIMHDHVHLVIRKHRQFAETMIERLQGASRDAVRRVGDRVPTHPVWGGPGWKVFLDSTEDIRRTVRYVEDNPVKARRPKQQFAFVTPYDDWPDHRRAK